MNLEQGGTSAIEEYSEYQYESIAPGHSGTYVTEPVLRLLHTSSYIRSVMEAGCGNGSFAIRLASEQFEVSAFDMSVSGISIAKKAGAHVHFANASVYDDLRTVFGGKTFDAVVAIEVIEHLYDPAAFLRRVNEVLRPDGIVILSTPYHGYFKNLSLALSGKLDSHFTALWTGGHIKFWSRRTLCRLLEGMGFEFVAFEGVGRAPYLWKSMIVVARKK